MSQLFQSIRAWGSAAMWLLAASVAVGQAPSDAVSGQQRGGETDPEDFKSRFSNLAGKISISPLGQSEQLFHFHTQPVLSWSNPARQTTAGAMFLWTDEGRPQVALCTYPDGTQSIDLEFQSLSDSALTASLGDEMLWQPTDNGVNWAVFNSSNPPAKTPSQRLRQMRTLARSFTSKLVPPNKNAIELRLLDTPVYRYQLPKQTRAPKQAATSSAAVIDGAVFCFVQGTDPEVLILIEARENDGAPQWRYSLARMSMVPMQVYLNESLVFETDWAVQRTYTPYYVHKTL